MRRARMPLPPVAFAAVALLSLAAGEGAGAEAGGTHPVSTVPSVDLVRYAGLWHEVARIPNRFQKQCVRGTTAEYALREDGRITVVNRCVERDGGTSQARGVARVVDASSRARLEVSFVSFLGWRPFWGDYWVLGLDEGYQWAVVGTPDRKYGWILARGRALDAQTLETVFAVLERNGYARSAFQMSLP